MSDTELHPEYAEPSEEELRELLESREREKEIARNRTSRTFSKILIVAAAILIGAIFAFPASRRTIGNANHEDLQVAATKAALSQLNPAAADVPDEMKPFSVKPEQDSERENLRFGMELLNFLRPPASPGESGPRK